MEGMALKKRWKAASIRVLLAFVLVVSMLEMSLTSASAKNDEPTVLAKAAIVIDADSGKILYEKNANKALGIASMSKMMTEFILLDKIKAGEISWDDKYNVSKYAYKVSHDTALSNVALREDGVYTVRELYEAMAIYSANAATIALTEIMAGSEKKFLPLMNKKAKELGLKKYTFYNATGLSNSQLQGMHPKGTPKKGENKMPAKEVAKLSYELLKEHPEVLDTASILKKTFAKGTKDAIPMENWNYMLKGGKYEYEGVDGLKTGSTDYAGQCFAATAKQGDLRVITIVMDAKEKNGDSTYKARFDATKVLLDYAFDNFEKKTILAKNATFADQKTIEVKNGKEKTVKIQATEPIEMVVNKNNTKAIKTELVLEYPSISAPVKKGAVVGHVKVTGDKYGYINPIELKSNVVTTTSATERGWLSKGFTGLGDFFENVWNKVF